MTDEQFAQVKERLDKIDAKIDRIDINKILEILDKQDRILEKMLPDPPKAIGFRIER